MIRQRVAELMDDPAIDRGEHIRALRSLNRTNRWFQTDQRLIREVLALCRGSSAVILELGCGGGGLVRHLADRRMTGQRLTAIGLDISKFALGVTQSLVAESVCGGCDFSLACVTADMRRLPLADRSVDVVVSSLVLHHFDRGDIVAVLKESARVARRGIIMADLTRSRTALVSTCLVTRLISRSQVFHVDGARSVRAALVPDELRKCARDAGLNDARVRRVFPFRMVLRWHRENA